MARKGAKAQRLKGACGSSSTNGYSKTVYLAWSTVYQVDPWRRQTAVPGSLAA